MKIALPILLLLVVSSCGHFHPLATKTDIGSKDGFTNLINPIANIESSTFGDFQFAFNQRQFKKLTGEKTDWKDILFYAKTEKPDYEYFVLLNPQKKDWDTEKWTIKDTVIADNNWVICISKNAPLTDKIFILNHLQSIY